VLEGARNAYWRLSAIENLRYFGGLRRMPARQLEQRAEEVLAFLELTEVANQEVRQFSRGMQQKVAIAIAMLHDPDVLLLDEPTLGLDVQSARTLEGRIGELAQMGKAVILTTHTMRLAESLATHILVMKQGQEVACGERSELFAQFDTRIVVEVQLAGKLSIDVADRLAAQFSGIVIEAANDNGTLISWADPAQTQVVELLQLLDRSGQTILGVNRRSSNLEEIFLSLTGPG
jgi:ABC-2 type transport system ATP-binding protein